MINRGCSRSFLTAEKSSAEKSSIFDRFDYELCNKMTATYGRWVLIERYFSEGSVYEEKADLSKTYWNLKRKMWVSKHFSEIIKQP